LRAAQHGADARQQFFGGKGLVEVVVGAGVEASYAVLVGGSRGKHDDRFQAALAQLAQDFEAVEHREHHVQDDHVVEAIQGAGKAAEAVMGGFHAESMLGEVGRHQAAQRRVVLNQQDRPDSGWCRIAHGVLHSLISHTGSVGKRRVLQNLIVDGAI